MPKVPNGRVPWFFHHETERDPMPVVMLESRRPVTLTGKGFEYTFIPGPNNVPDSVWERLNDPSSGSSSIRYYISTQQLTLLRPDGEGNVESLQALDLSKMEEYSAVEFVKTVVDPAVLRMYRDKETGRADGGRKKVLETLDQQIKVMTPTPHPGESLVLDGQIRGSVPPPVSPEEGAGKKFVPVKTVHKGALARQGSGKASKL